jgi:hypothetical protein
MEGPVSVYGSVSKRPNDLRILGYDTFEFADHYDGEYVHENFLNHFTY